MSSEYYTTRHWRELREQCLRRDGFRCTTPGCGSIGRIADHIKTRPDVPTPTPFDVIGNLRTLCKTCDAQIKERGPNRERKQGGVVRVRGCDVNGVSRDPRHPWRA